MPKSSTLGVQSGLADTSPVSSPAPTSPTAKDGNRLAMRADTSLDLTSLPPITTSPASPRLADAFEATSPRPIPARVTEQNLRQVPQSPLDREPSHHPYALGPISELASRSHGNLLETMSMRSGSVPETAMSEGDPWKPHSLPRTPKDHPSGSKKINTRVLRDLLSRSNSNHKSFSPSSKTPDDQHVRITQRKRVPRLQLPESNVYQPAGRRDNLKTAPLEPDRLYREAMGSSTRNKSADRATVTSEDETIQQSHRQQQQQPTKLQGSRESGAIWSNIKSGSTGTANAIGRAGKGILGKITRAGSDSHPQQPSEESLNQPFVLLNLPLVEQTRRTRIQKRMEDARDKTEFWMPALPYRCIDYLNMKGVEEEGLYRVPGSGREVKYWQSRFDKEGDVNLLDAENLYDINIIGSMLKAWLRELPDELFPKAAQTKIATECSGAQTTPQLMKDELSKLPPYHYYILFAITCHISLLHSNHEKNKMTFHNICVCFQPCMKIEGFCFQFLVMDWKNCWQGCWTEKEWLQVEYQILSNPSADSGRLPGTHSAPRAFSSEQSLSLSHSSDNKSQVRPATAEARSPNNDRDALESTPDVPTRPRSGSTGDVDAASIAANVSSTASSPSVTKHSRGHSTPPALSPVVALSPMRM